MEQPMNTLDGLPILEFRTSNELHVWLEEHHASSDGMWLRIYKKSSHVQSVAFEEVLDEGLCFGWSESKRRKYNHTSYLQRFTPRKAVGSHSPRNLARAQKFMEIGRMTLSGSKALNLPAATPIIDKSSE
jgi:uncharacterized protein YdeI (YjbR/CyaY-like superfamily)